MWRVEWQWTAHNRHTSVSAGARPLVRPVKVFRESEAGTKGGDVTAICASAPAYGWEVAKRYLFCIVEDTFGDAVFCVVTLLNKLCWLCNIIYYAVGYRDIMRLIYLLWAGLNVFCSLDNTTKKRPKWCLTQ